MNVSIITLITSLTALSASIFGPLVALRTARVQFNASVLSNNRQKWINALRDLIATYQSQLVGAALYREGKQATHWIDFASDSAMVARAENMVLTISKIRLMINPLESDHGTLVETMEQGIGLIRSNVHSQSIEQDVDGIINSVTTTGQAILKREWMRVKEGR